MTDGELPFSHEYAKHDRAVFPTIRRRDKFGDVGETVEVTADGEKLGDAEVVAKETVRFGDLPTWLVCYDCDVDVSDWSGELRDAAYDHINNFYRISIGMDEPLTMYWLRWVGDSDQQELVTDGGVDTDRDTVAYAYHNQRLVGRVYDSRLARDLERNDDYHVSWADDTGGDE